MSPRKNNERRRPDDTPWDVFVDERKIAGDYSLGFLVVPNTASFLHKLFKCRQRPADSGGRTHVAREIHWNKPHLDAVRVATGWIDCVFQHRGAKFYCYSWQAGQSKEFVVLRFLDKMCRNKRLHPPYNVVVFLDYDSDHAKARIQNTIRESGRVARCYHLDSTNNDCLQCCDLLLGAICYLDGNPGIRLNFPELKRRFDAGEKLRDSEVKQYLAGYLGIKVETDGTCVCDRRTINSR